MMTGNSSVVASDEVKEGWIIKEKGCLWGVVSMYSIYLTVIVIFGFIGICIDQNSLNCIF